VTIYQVIREGILDRKALKRTADRIRKDYGIGYLLGSSTKIEASNSAREGYLSYIQYLSPADGYSRATNERVPSLCPYATKGCTVGCLGKSAGKMRLTSSQQAQVKRSRLYHRDRAGYFTVLADEILRAKRKADREGLQLSIRLNGTSDVKWEDLRVNVLGVQFYNIFEAFPDVIFYDYTKIPLRYRQRGVNTSNYHLTYSYTGESVSIDRAFEYLSIGLGVSVVYLGNPEREVSRLFPSAKSRVNGDVHDMRFLDPKGSIVPAKRDHSGFVIRG